MLVRCTTIAVTIASLAGCWGKIGDASIAELPGCEERTLPVQPLRRLSSTQYHNVISDLFGPALAGPLRAGSLFPPTVVTAGFSADADQNTVNTRQSNAIEDEAERIAQTIIASPEPWLRALVPCTLGSPIADAEIDACIDQFVTTFGSRAYRRPIDAAEAALARRVFTEVRATQTATQAWASVVQFFVQAPALLYRVERGTQTAPPGKPALVTLTPHELASRLSFLLTDSGPDEELRRAADAGELASAEQVEAQARRLMSSPRFYEVLAAFHNDWMHLHEAGIKDPTVVPGYSAQVMASMNREAGELVRHVVDEGDGSLRSLLLAAEFPVDSVLAAYYGVPAPASGQWHRVPMPGRLGILQLGGVQAALSGATTSSPIHRGNFFRSAVLCEPQLVFPANVDISTPLEATAHLPTARERLAPLLSNSQCSGCHRQMNPLGLAFENFDAGGRWRDQENGTTIDASGEFDLGAGRVSFTGPADLAARLADSRKVQDCYALQWYRAGNGRTEVAEDTCSVTTLRELVAETGGDLRELLVALTQTDAFLYRRSGE